MRTWNLLLLLCPHTHTHTHVCTNSSLERTLQSDHDLGSSPAPPQGNMLSWGHSQTGGLQDPGLPLCHCHRVHLGLTCFSSASTPWGLETPPRFPSHRFPLSLPGLSCLATPWPPFLPSSPFSLPCGVLLTCPLVAGHPFPGSWSPDAQGFPLLHPLSITSPGCPGTSHLSPLPPKLATLAAVSSPLPPVASQIPSPNQTWAGQPIKRVGSYSMPSTIPRVLMMAPNRTDTRGLS